MSLMANLYVGMSGLQTSQQALNTTAHNMANLDTQGYTRQQVSLGTRSYLTLEKKLEPIAWHQVGNGVYYNNCKQVRSVFLDAAYRQEYGRFNFYDVSLKSIEEIEDQLQEMNGSEFAESLNNLWVSVQELAKDPCSAVTQSAYVTRASEFLTRAKTVYDGLVSYQENLDSTIEGMCNTINSYGERLRELNEEVVDIEAGNQEHANDLRDERNVLLDKLGEYGRLDYYEDVFGNVLVSFEGEPFVTTDHVNHIAVDRSVKSSVGYGTPYWEHTYEVKTNEEGESETTFQDVCDLTQPIATSINTDIGKLKAVVLARGDHNGNYHDIQENEQYYTDNIAESVLMNVQAEFDQMIHHIMTTINDIMEASESNPAFLDSSKGSAKDFILFVESNTEDAIRYKIGDIDPDNLKDGQEPIHTGFTIKNTQINPRLIEDPTLFTYRRVDGSEDNTTTSLLKEAFTKENYTLNPGVTTKNSFVSYYNSLVSQVANTGDIYESIKTSQEITADSVSAAREQIVGVSSDEELEYMIMFQNAYNASSRFVNVVSEMLEHLVTTLGA